MSLSPENSASYSLYCGEDARALATWDVDTWVLDPPTTTDFPAADDCLIARLIDTELDFVPDSDYLERFRDGSIDVTARQDAINWMQKVHAFYHFRPVTAYLCVSYLDRFLSSHTLPQENGWPLQLLSMACLSLAAKMEETNVPLLLDLQVFEPKFVFEPKNVQRMELLVMAHLKWRMRSVTPFDFVDYFVAKLPCFGSRYPLSSNVFSRASDLIISTSRVIDFLGYPPSTIAAAAVLCAADQCVDFPASEDGKTAYYFERVSKEMVRSCHQLMEEYLTERCPLARIRHRRAEPEPEPEPAPPSPVGVLDAAACGSCDTQKSGSENPEPSIKRRRSAPPSDVQQQ